MLRIIRLITKHFFLSITILVCLALLLGCYQRYFATEKLSFLGVLTYGIFYISIFLLLLCLFWLLVKPKISLIIILSLILCIPSFQKILKFKDHGFKLNKYDSTFRVMSWNVEGFKLNEIKTKPYIKSQMIKMLRNYSPDVACFQEMIASDTAKTAYNYLPALMNEIDMPYYSFVYNNDNMWDNKQHLGVLICSKYPILNTTKYRLNNGKYSNFLQVCRVGFPNDTINIMNLHLKSYTLGDKQRSFLEEKSITNKAEDLETSKNIFKKLKNTLKYHHTEADLVAKVKDSLNNDVIICGDFNDVPDSYAYHKIGAKLINAFEQKGIGFGRTYSKISPTLRIDNIFYNNQFEIIQFKTDQRDLSDHYAVVVDLKNKS